jgi:hypothetical protein
MEENKQKISLNNAQIQKALSLISNGLERYLWIQGEFKKKDVTKNGEFQKIFNGFYKVRRNEDWRKKFYSLLEKNKNNYIEFKDILSDFYKKTGRMEASFISKLVATVNPRMPVIDKIVFKNVGLKLPYTKKRNRDLIIEEQYKILIKKYLFFLKTKEGVYLVKEFTKKYPKAKITKIKMLDLVLWQTR